MTDLVVENDILRERIAQLEALHLGTDMIVPPEWKLTGSEATIMRVLVKREVAPKECLLLALYGNRNQDWPVDNLLSVFVCRINTKLEHLGIRVKCARNYGYYLDSDTRQSIKRMVAA